MGKLSSIFILFISCLGLIGCTPHVEHGDISSMREMNAGWNSEALKLKETLAQASNEYKEYRSEWSDTANFLAKAALSDSSFMARVTKTERGYEDWFGKCLACVNTLEGAVADNNTWIDQLVAGHDHSTSTQRGWDSRRIRFYQSLEQCRSLASQQAQYQNEIFALKKRISP